MTKSKSNNDGKRDFHSLQFRRNARQRILVRERHLRRRDDEILEIYRKSIDSRLQSTIKSLNYRACIVMKFRIINSSPHLDPLMTGQAPCKVR